MAMMGGQKTQYSEPTNVGTLPIRNLLVVSASENLDMQISELNETISALLNRLAPVLRIDHPCEVEKTGAQIKETTPLSCTLDCYVNRVYQMRYAVNDALDRLEI